MMWEGGSSSYTERKKMEAKRYSLLDLAIIFVFGFIVMDITYQLVTDRESFRCKFTPGCEVRTTADAEVPKGEVKEISSEELKCEDALYDAPGYVKDTKWLEGKCYMLSKVDDRWEELPKGIMEIWHDQAEAKDKDAEIQRKLNSD